ncbi:MULTISPECIES: glutamate ABC transporter substrate-binding protein [unclassified Actinomyces]|uniref:glutamate ABC transporter substrate-binding protein n=1 Tax=unclassified Actinomyces TaxID=2609248 RepID=UPI002016FED0|nr:MULTISPECIES: glutamate ABC transporter substrate-binding protein [unclassified Actinomyces]MCL3778596.1 glutamate ABC transporter substrate-binding protein [Actinomyces sp. AC-20-1]MCL3790337.1 glutamate ABC transporter substrate-binding protein [Actinomyces sp. 187325]MCL3792955.1 glutamate ABC transporter substrate-binding protein [Actinomyces sp. 186855]MCL3795134.1 glutamate ABC transporter substrate-binding protein [Actinomyces sp. 217892]
MAILNRRTLLTASGALSLAAALAACADTGADGQAVSGATAEAAAAGTDYDTAISSGPVASQDVVAASAWASAVREAGVLRVGGVKTSQIFSLEDPATGRVTGFDAALSQALARYILGGDDPSALTELTVVTSDTRETLLENGSVDAVLATYTITPARAEKISFAGPYYSSGQAVLVRAENTQITGVDTLAGHTVAVQSNSSSGPALDEAAPEAQQVQLEAHTDCVAALEAGQVEAYVVDHSLLLSTVLGNDGLKIVGEPFTEDPYGIGLPKGSDAQAFVNTFLRTIESDGTWEAIWRATIGTVLGQDKAPTPPAIGSVPGSETV